MNFKVFIASNFITLFSIHYFRIKHDRLTQKDISLANDRLNSIENQIDSLSYYIRNKDK